jgi:hypothetical protein
MRWNERFLAEEIFQMFTCNRDTFRKHQPTGFLDSPFSILVIKAKVLSPFKVPRSSDLRDLFFLDETARTR